MKKLIYSLAFIALGLVGCTSFDDAVTEKYGEGPAIAINITSTTDSAFTFTLTPGEGTQFYNFIIDENDEAEELDASALLQGLYGNSDNVCKAADAPTTTLTIDAEPNTTYQIYAVAASDKGIVGQVTVAAVTTTDQNAPTLVKNAFEPVAEDKAVVVAFNQDILRGNGAVTGVYYKEWDWENPVTIDPADIVVEIDGDEATISAPTTPDGAILAFSWEAGAFVDAKGNACGAFTTTYDEEEDDFIGAAVQNKKVAFEIADSCVTAPADGALIAKVEDFKGEITFPFNIYRIEEAVETGDLSVNLEGDKRSASYKLAADDWSIKDNVLSFVLPTTPEGGDIITVSIVEGAVADVYGNPNAAFTSETSWQFFAPTKDMVLGTFEFLYLSAYDEEPKAYDGGPITISENSEKENGLIIKGLFSDYVEGSELDGSYDLSSGKLYIDAYQILGKFTNSKGTTYGLVLYSQTYEDLIEFTINADGTITSTDLGIVAYDEAFENAIGWFEKASVAQFKPQTTATARSLKKSTSKAKKLNARVHNVKKHVSK